jgi:DNA-directed RNA polymerase specialized sigma24 family protein
MIDGESRQRFWPVCTVGGQWSRMAAFENRFDGDRPVESGRSRVCPNGIDVPVLLARWRSREVWIARQFRACGGASPAEVEELYDATVAVLVEKGDSYKSAEHLRAALHRGIKMRALRLHRDRQVHRRTLELAAPTIEEDGREQRWRDQPERALIAREDDVIVGEFIAELTPLERRVFALVADGRSWRAIATALSLPETEARTVTRACERKRARFLSLYITGRLCGYRSATIESLLAGRVQGELAFGKAVAHLRHCRACRARHRTDVAGLRATFDARVLSVLPALPVVVESHAWLVEQLHAAVSRVARLSQRGSTVPGGGRPLEVVVGGGVAGKVAVGLASVALLAGGAVGAGIGRRAVGHHHASRRATALRSRAGVPPAASARRAAPRSAALPRSHRLPRSSQQRTPGGFSYLGVPSPPPSRHTAMPVVHQHGGGPFGP